MSMRVAARQLPLLGGSGTEGADTRARRERRHEVVRHVEYAPFPRISARQGERVGFTRDISPSGLCLRVEASEPIGSLLRVIASAVDGRPTRESIARVVWCSPTADGAFWLGLSVLERGRPASARVAPASSPASLRDCA